MTDYVNRSVMDGVKNPSRYYTKSYGNLIPGKVTILERPFTNQESHASGDHRGCGGSCYWSRIDTRPSPIFDKLRAEVEEKRIRSHMNHFEAIEVVLRSADEAMTTREVHNARCHLQGKLPGSGTAATYAALTHLHNEGKVALARPIRPYKWRWV